MNHDELEEGQKCKICRIQPVCSTPEETEQSGSVLGKARSKLKHSFFAYYIVRKYGISDAAVVLQVIED